MIIRLFDYLRDALGGAPGAGSIKKSDITGRFSQFLKLSVMMYELRI